jgi:hypothetical protein
MIKLGGSRVGKLRKYNLSKFFVLRNTLLDCLNGVSNGINQTTGRKKVSTI